MTTISHIFCTRKWATTEAGPGPLLLLLAISGRNRKRQEPGHKPTNPPLVLPILGILPRRYPLGQPHRALKDRKVTRNADGRPIVRLVRDETAPEVNERPDYLLGGEIWVSGKRPEACYDEAAREVACLEAWWSGTDFAVFAFSFLESYWGSVSQVAEGRWEREVGGGRNPIVAGRRRTRRLMLALDCRRR